MKFLVVLAAFVAIAAAGTTTNVHDAVTILRQVNEAHPDGAYTTA
jgi:hypothetical protein